MPSIILHDARCQTTMMIACQGTQNQRICTRSTTRAVRRPGALNRRSALSAWLRGRRKRSLSAASTTAA